MNNKQSDKNLNPLIFNPSAKVWIFIDTFRSEFFIDNHKIEGIPFWGNDNHYTPLCPTGEKTQDISLFLAQTH